MKKRSVGSVSCHQRPCSVCSVCFRPLFDYFDRTASEKGGGAAGPGLEPAANTEPPLLEAAERPSVGVFIVLVVLHVLDVLAAAVFRVVVKLLQPVSSD